jgi:hypothetical protein
MAPFAACDSVRHVCVQCTTTQAAACTGSSPVCSNDDHCRGCALHAECLVSNVCRPDGACESAVDVAYASSTQGTDNAPCTMTMPCRTISRALAIGRAVVKLQGNFDESVTINNQSVMILADPGTTLTRTGGGTIVSIQGSSSVTIRDLTIAGTSTTTGVSVMSGAPVVMLDHVAMSGHGGSAIDVTGGMLRLSRSVLSNNSGGGISLSMAQFDIENNFIVKNGSTQSSVGGILFDRIAPGQTILAFNTIVANQIQSFEAAGITCIGSGQNVTFSNNLIYNNAAAGGGPQVIGNNCLWTYSDIGPDGLVSGQGNLNVDPQFVDASNVHLRAGSPVIDKADPSATLGVDIDGDIRPQGNVRDIGADEYKAP